MTIVSTGADTTRAFPHQTQESHDITPVLVTTHPHLSRPPPQRTAVSRSFFSAFPPCRSGNTAARPTPHRHHDR
jgi:hypothetical protein